MNRTQRTFGIAALITEAGICSVDCDARAGAIGKHGWRSRIR